MISPEAVVDVSELLLGWVDFAGEVTYTNLQIDGMH